jgi:uncharacterized protein (DUF4415 family)
MPKLKPGHISPTGREDAQIMAGITQDPDAREWGKEEFSQARPAAEVLSPEIVAAMKRARGRPVAEEPKVPTTIRLDADVVSAFKATGKGWQSRMNQALRKYLLEHPIA